MNDIFKWSNSQFFSSSFTIIQLFDRENFLYLRHFSTILWFNIVYWLHIGFWFQGTFAQILVGEKFFLHNVLVAIAWLLFTFELNLKVLVGNFCYWAFLGLPYYTPTQKIVQNYVAYQLKLLKHACSLFSFSVDPIAWFWEWKFLIWI